MFSCVFASPITFLYFDFTCDTTIFLISHQQQETGFKNSLNNLSSLYARAQDDFPPPLPSPMDFLDKTKSKIKLAQIKIPLFSALLWFKKKNQLEVHSFRKVNTFPCISASMSTITGQEIKLIIWQHSWSSTLISLKKLTLLMWVLQTKTKWGHGKQSVPWVT